MKLKEIANILTIASLILTTTVAALLWTRTFKLEDTVAKEKLLNNISKTINHRRLLTGKYLRHRKIEHALAWQVLYDTSVANMQSPQFENLIDQEILEELREYNVEIKEIFAKLIYLYESELLQVASSNIIQHQTEGLLAKLWVSEDSLFDGINRLEEINTQKRTEIFKLNKTIAMCSMIGLIGLIFSLASIVNIKIVLRLSRLIEGIEIISKGNIQHTIQSTGKDEISQLTLSFNSMVATLRSHIHEIKTQQVALVNTSKMSALGEMAGGIAHEINNPLAIISLSADSLKSLIGSDNFDKQLANQLAEKIETTVTRIAKIVKGLRTFSRDGKNDPFEKISLNRVMEDCLSLCSIKFKENGVKILVEKTSDDLLIECQPVQISQVLLNIMNNSFDAIEKFQIKWIKIQFSEVNDFIKISITDSGSGIPADIASKIMLPFFTTKDIGRGTGLGLSVAAGIIQMHNGKIEIDTTCINTRFNIYLPKVQLQQAAA